MLSLTFTDEAFESYQTAVERLISSVPSTVRYFVQVTESDTGAKFDAWLIGVDREAEMGDTMRVVRVPDGDEWMKQPGWLDVDLDKAESVRAEQIHIY